LHLWQSVYSDQASRYVQQVQCNIQM
jgi:hypothetical protein